MTIPRIMFAIKDPCAQNERSERSIRHSPKQWMNETNDTHWSEDHMQWHGDVKVQGVVIDNADGKEHSHHDHIVTAKEEGHWKSWKTATLSDVLMDKRENQCWM